MPLKKPEARTKIVTIRLSPSEHERVLACGPLLWKDAPVKRGEVFRHLLLEGCNLVRKEMRKKHCWAFLTAVAVTSLS